MKKVVFMALLFFFVWAYLGLFTNFWRAPVIYIHSLDKANPLTVWFEDSNADGGTLQSDNEGVARFFPQYPPFTMVGVNGPGIYIFWAKKENLMHYGSINLSTDEINFCTMDIYLDANNSIVETKQDNRQGFDCLKWVVKRNLLGID